MLPDSVAAFVKAKMEAARHYDSMHAPASTPPESGQRALPALPATADDKPPRRMTKKELQYAERNVPYHTTPQGRTDARLACAIRHSGSHNLSFIETCREWLTISPYIGVDKSKTVVSGKWSHSIVAVSRRVAMIFVRPRKSIRVINWLFGGMRGRLAVHDRILIYAGFWGQHQECWVHLLRRFMKLAMKSEMGSPEYDRYLVIASLYRRSDDLADRIAGRLGVSRNAAEADSCKYRLPKVWGEFKAEYDSIMAGLRALLKDLRGQEPAGYLEGILPRLMTFIFYPGTPGHNNGPEQVIRWHVVRPRHVFGSLPNWRAARNHAVIQTLAATCRRNGTSPYRAILNGARDPNWDVFSSAVPPPIFPHMA